MKQIDLINEWASLLRTGLFNGRPFSEHTVSQYVAYLTKFLGQYDTLTIESFRHELASIPVEQFGKRDKFYKAVICFAKFLEGERRLPKGFLEKAKTFRPKRHRPPIQKTVDEKALQAIMDACQTHEERLIVILLASTGLRATEACNLNLEDILLEDGRLIVRVGKWGGTRKLGLTPSLTEAITQYLASRTGAKPTDPLLTNNKGQRMDRFGLNYRLQTIAQRVGVEASPHCMRRAFVTINVNKGRPLVHLQIACGHKDIKTTRSYCQTTEDEVVEAMKEW